MKPHPRTRPHENPRPVVRPWLGAVLLALLLPLATAAPLRAEVACHCFRDRSFVPQQPAASDPYLLATTQNSLLSMAYGVSKQQVVRQKMTGVAGADLWVAHRAAQRTSATAADLLEQRGGAGSWAQVLTRRSWTPDAALGVAADGAPDDASLAAAVVDATLREQLGARPQDLALLRRAGAQDAEVILAIYLARRGQRPALELYHQVQSDGTSWSELLHRSGGAPDQVEEDLRRLH